LFAPLLLTPKAEVAADETETGITLTVTVHAFTRERAA
jgi:hypothetical protein